MLKHKLINFDQIDVKFDSQKAGFFSGYASVFGGIDSYGDTVIPGAYAKTLKTRIRPIQMRWNHYGDVIGKWTGIEETEKGLYVEGELTPGHSKASDVYASLKHGAISGLSIGYHVVKGVPNANDGIDLHEIDLVEISVVESPADLGAKIGEIKSAIDEIESLKEMEGFLRDAGSFSRSEAKQLVSCLKALVLRDEETKTAQSDFEGKESSKETAAYIAAITLKSILKGN